MSEPWYYKKYDIQYNPNSPELFGLLELAPVKARPILAVLRIIQPGTVSPPHIDYLPKGYRRFHWPITSNDKCFMTWPEANVEVHMEPGHLYEVNVSEMHMFRNLGQTERMHLVADYVPGATHLECVGDTGHIISSSPSCLIAQVGPRTTKLLLNGEILEIGPNSTLRPSSGPGET